MALTVHPELQEIIRFSDNPADIAQNELLQMIQNAAIETAGKTMSIGGIAKILRAEIADILLKISESPSERRSQLDQARQRINRKCGEILVEQNKQNDEKMPRVWQGKGKRVR